MVIYHIICSGAQDAVPDDGYYETESLSTVGFIHCSYEHQLESVIQRYYPDAAAVQILAIDTEKLTSPLVEEPSTNNEIYPHVYGAIDRDAIVGIEVRVQ